MIWEKISKRWINKIEDMRISLLRSWKIKWTYKSMAEYIWISVRCLEYIRKKWITSIKTIQKFRDRWLSIDDYIIAKK